MFDEYSVTFDGTRSFTEAEAIVICCITKRWEVIEVLVRCSLFKKKLNGLTLANHVIDTIVNRVGLHLKNWLSAQQDRASTNKTCLREITERFPDAKPTTNFCCTHGLSNSGKQIFGKNGSAKYARKFQKQWQKIIQYPGKARQRATVIFKE